MRLRPKASARSMARTGVLGVATKNLLIGMDVPAAAPPAQDGPEESCRSAGTKTLKLPAESVCRNGRSWVIGLVASVVYGWVPPGRPEVAEKLWAGAPGSPEKTWFHTPFVQPSRLVFRTRNCCCEPLMTVPPENHEAAMNPPLANRGPAEQWHIRDRVRRVMLTRRIGAACDTAQKSVPEWQPDWPAMLMVRLDSERQKLTSAMQLLLPSVGGEHWVYTSIVRWMVTSPGDLPRPATSV